MDGLMNGWNMVEYGLEKATAKVYFPVVHPIFMRTVSIIIIIITWHARISFGLLFFASLLCLSVIILSPRFDLITTGQLSEL